MSLKHFPIVVCLLLLAGDTALAQAVTGTLAGHVTDQTGGRVPGVTIKAVGQENKGRALQHHQR
ncbi:MAG: hypothetical protein ACR2L2_14885 [Acidobacteriota bacterium]